MRRSDEWTCLMPPFKEKPITNADHIRNMSDEELKVYLCYISDCAMCLWQSSSGCKLEDWLKQPYEGATE